MAARVTLALAVLVLAAGARAADFSIEATLVGGPGLNPNLEGKASPVVVRVFELRRTEAFLAADYAALFEHADQALGQDLVRQEEVLLRPGEIRHHDRRGEPLVKALGLAAAFRSLNGESWRLVVPLAPDAHNLLLIDFDGQQIRVPALTDGAAGR